MESENAPSVRSGEDKRSREELKGRFGAHEDIACSLTLGPRAGPSPWRFRASKSIAKTLRRIVRSLLNIGVSVSSVTPNVRRFLVYRACRAFRGRQKPCRDLGLGLRARLVEGTHHTPVKNRVVAGEGEVEDDTRHRPVDVPKG